MSKARELAELGAAYDSGALSNRNLIINGGMEVVQRGNDAKTGNATDLYGTDRFRAIENNSGSMSSQQVADGPVGFYYSNKLTITGTDSSLASTEYGRQLTSIEGQSMAHLNWGTANAQTVTLSFYVKCSLTGTFYVSLFNSAADRSFVAGYTIDAADTWERKSIIITGPTDGTWLATNGAGVYVTWSIGAGSTYQTSTLNSWASAFDMSGSDQVNLFATNAATWQLTGVQMELGTEATPFEHRSFGDELQKCQRYFFQETGTATDASGRLGVASGSTAVVYDHTLPVQMRAKPSVALTSTSLRIGDTVAAGFTTTSGTIAISTYSGFASATYTLGGFSGLTSYRTYLHEPDSSNPGIVNFDAEL